MSPEFLRAARQNAGLTQQRAADRLKVSQAYLALMESGRRRVPARLGSKIVKLYGAGPVALPFEADGADSWDSASLAAALAALGYAGFGQLRGGRPQNPALVLLAAVSAADVEVRVIEALPWLVVRYSDLDWERLIREVKLRDVQNRLGFVVTLAREVAAKQGDSTVDARLRGVEEVLEHARLAREDTLCQASLSEAERRWLRQKRPAAASHWNLLTNMTTELLRYVA